MGANLTQPQPPASQGKGAGTSDSVEKSPGQTFAVIIQIVTVLVTVVVAIPAFRQLSQDRPYVYFHADNINFFNNQYESSTKARAILARNGIPDSQYKIQLSNAGEGPAKEVKIDASVPGKIIEINCVPKESDKPIWVEVPTAANLASFTNQSRCVLQFSNLAPTKVLSVEIGYSAETNGTPSFQMLYDQKPGIQVESIASAPRITTFHLFKLPLQILGIGTAFTLFVAVIIVASNKKQLVNSLSSTAMRVLTEILRTAVRF